LHDTYLNAFETCKGGDSRQDGDQGRSHASAPAIWRHGNVGNFHVVSVHRQLACGDGPLRLYGDKVDASPVALCSQGPSKSFTELGQGPFGKAGLMQRPKVTAARYSKAHTWRRFWGR
jgi:hypothetical protein